MIVDDIEVWVECGDERLDEYSTRVESQATRKIASCFIPSESGNKFIICWKNGSSDYYLVFESELDGSFAGCSPTPPRTRWRRRDVLTSSTVRRPFVFSELATSDDDSLLLAAPISADFGTIKVSARRIEKVGHQDANRVRKGSGFQSVGTVHEQSKKAGAHCVGLGEEVNVKPNEGSKSSYVDIDQEPIVTFIFRYKPQALLQAQGIISFSLPPAGEPGPSSYANQPRFPTGTEISRKHKHANDYEVDTKPSRHIKSDEERELEEKKRQRRQLEKEIELLEKKAGRSSKRVKKEEPYAESTYASNGDVIDLTLSD